MPANRLIPRRTVTVPHERRDEHHTPNSGHTENRTPDVQFTPPDVEKTRGCGDCGGVGDGHLGWACVQSACGQGRAVRQPWGCVRR